MPWFPVSRACRTSGPEASSGNRRIQPGRNWSSGPFSARPSGWARPRLRSRISLAREASPSVLAAMDARVASCPPVCAGSWTTNTLIRSSSSAAVADAATPSAMRQPIRTAARARSAVRAPRYALPIPGLCGGGAPMPLLMLFVHVLSCAFRMHPLHGVARSNRSQENLNHQPPTDRLAESHWHEPCARAPAPLRGAGDSDESTLPSSVPLLNRLDIEPSTAEAVVAGGCSGTAASGPLWASSTTGNSPSTWSVTVRTR